MRNIKQLLELMLENKNLFYSGLCDWTHNLYYKNIIITSEKDLLLKYIKSNKPSKYSSFSAFFRSKKFSHYYWEKWDIEPRVKLIKNQIKKQVLQPET